MQGWVGRISGLLKTATPVGAAGGDLAGTYPNPTIGLNNVTFSKMQDINTGVLIGRDTAGVGDPEELTVSEVKTLLAYTPGDIGAEPAFTKNTAFNKDFGTTAGTVLEGDTVIPSALWQADFGGVSPIGGGNIGLGGSTANPGFLIYSSGIGAKEVSLQSTNNNASIRVDANLVSHINITGGTGAYLNIGQATAPASLTDNLYNVGGELFWNGQQLTPPNTAVGDVVGPASSTDNNIALFDGATGKLIKDSGALLSSKEDSFTKNTAFNKNFGTGIGNVVEGPHQIDTTNPHSVTTGQIGAEPAFTKNTAFNKDFGSLINTVCQGNDPRLSDTRDPNAHASEHTDGTDDIQDATLAQKGLMTIAQATKLNGIETGAEVNLPFGKEYNYSSSEGQSDTSSLTPVNKLSFTTPTLPAGNYRINFYFEWLRSTASNDFLSRVQLDGTSIMEQNEESKDPNSWHPLSGFYYGALTNATHTITVDFWGESGGGNVSSTRKVRIEIFRVS